MSNYSPIYMPDDKVFYTGEKFKQELTRDGKPLTGWIHAAVQNEKGAWVVWFPETKESDSYILHEENMSHYRPSKAERTGPEVQPRRVKVEELEGE
jgi:hypothetical protein